MSLGALVKEALFWLSIVVVVGGAALVILWRMIDWNADLVPRVPAPAPRPEHLGTHRLGHQLDQDRFRPPSRERIQWLGGDDTMGFWIWNGEPPDEPERFRRNL